MSTHKQGFVALFFILGISSILLAWVVMSSSSIFEYLAAKRQYDEYYQSALADVTCADMFADFLARSPEIPSGTFARRLFYSDQVICHITQVTKTRVSPDVWAFSFISNKLFIRGRIRKGFIEYL